MNDNLVEKVAEAIFKHAVCEPRDYDKVVGEPMKAWRSSPPWEHSPYQLEEKEREHYRRMAKAAINAYILTPISELVDE